MAARADTTDARATRCPACAEPLPATPTLRGSDLLHGTPGRFEVLVCGACGSGLTLPLVESAELGRYYPSEYNAYALPSPLPLRAAATLLFRWRYWRGLRRPPLGALRELPPRRLLDVGGGRGDLGVVLRRSGWDVLSIDPSEDACAAARERDVASARGTLTDLPGAVDGPYDAIVFQHSLEHVVDPSADLATARRLLAPDGVLLITVPNFGSWQSRRFRERWFHLDLPRHRAHFTPRGLEELLRRSGFEAVDLSTSTSSDGLPMSLQFRLLGRRVAPGAGRYAATALTLLATPLTAALNTAAGAGDFLHAVARRAP